MNRFQHGVLSVTVNKKGDRTEGGCVGQDQEEIVNHLTINIAGFKTGGTVGELWGKHRGWTSVLPTKSSTFKNGLPKDDDTHNGELSIYHLI
jgi:hypothetical protein